MSDYKSKRFKAQLPNGDIIFPDDVAVTGIGDILLFDEIDRCNRTWGWVDAPKDTFLFTDEE